VFASYSRLMPVDFEQPSWETDKYAGRHVAPVGVQAGAQELAANVYELDPGAVGSPLHVHHANEELLLVLAEQRLAYPSGANADQQPLIAEAMRAAAASH
jgi:uncharacterized cupin superfamily protein